MDAWVSGISVFENLGFHISVLDILVVDILVFDILVSMFQFSIF